MRKVLQVGYSLCFAIAFMPLASLALFFSIDGEDFVAVLFFMGILFGLPAGVSFAHLSRVAGLGGGMGRGGCR